MKRGLAFVASIVCILSISCDQGLAPPELNEDSLDFPVELHGGNPVGLWVPDQNEPVEVFLYEEFPVDSVVFVSEMEGTFNFEYTGHCSVDATLSIRPLIYNQGVELPLNIVISDTLFGMGRWEMIKEDVMGAPVESSVLNVDTLGFSAHQSTLDLVSLPTSFVFENTIHLDFYCIVHLVRNGDQSLASKPVHLYKEEDLP